MSLKKKILGLLLILATFSILFIIFIPSFYSNNTAGKFEKEVDINLQFLEKEEKPIVLIFFGYVGCTDVCTPALHQLNEIYKKIDSKNVSLYFINLLTSADPQSVDAFAKSFNPAFKGVYLNQKEIDTVITKLNVMSVPSLLDKNVIDHSAFLHLFEKEDGAYKQKYIYTTSPFDMDYIIKDITKIQGELKW